MRQTPLRAYDLAKQAVIHKLNDALFSVDDGEFSTAELEIAEAAKLVKAAIAKRQTMIDGAKR